METPATSPLTATTNPPTSVYRRVVADDGYVELIDFMGKGDLSVVNAARVSFGKQKT